MADSGPVLEGTILRLRPAQVEETSTIFEWLSDPETLQFMNLEDPLHLDVDSMAARFERLAQELEAGEMQILMDALLPSDRVPNPVTVMYGTALKPVELIFSITQKDNDALVGVIVLRVSVLHRTGIIRTVIAPECRRMGFGKEAKVLVLRYAFERLKLFKVSSHLLEQNEATFDLNLRLGFVVEGRFNGEVIIRGKRCNLVCMAMTRAVWLRDHQL